MGKRILMLTLLVGKFVFLHYTLNQIHARLWVLVGVRFWLLLLFNRLSRLLGSLSLIFRTSTNQFIEISDSPLFQHIIKVDVFFCFCLFIVGVCIIVFLALWRTWFHHFLSLLWCHRCINSIVHSLLHITGQIYFIELLLNVYVWLYQYHIFILKWLFLHCFQICIHTVKLLRFSAKGSKDLFISFES